MFKTRLACLLGGSFLGALLIALTMSPLLIVGANDQNRNDRSLPKNSVHFLKLGAGDGLAGMPCDNQSFIESAVDVWAKTRVVVVFSVVPEYNCVWGGNQLGCKTFGVWITYHNVS